MSQSGIPSGDDTLGAATFDLIFDDTKWAWVAPGVLDVITDLDQTVTGSGLPYTVSLSLSGGGTNVLRATVTNNPTVDVLIYGGANVIGGAPIEVIQRYLF